MSLRLNSSGGGSVTLQEPNTASALTLSLPAVTGTVITTADSGTVTPTMLSQKLTLATAQNTTSGTAIDFTGIPSWVRRVTVVLSGVSTNGSSDVIIQLGTGSTTYTTSGYSAASARLSYSSASGGSNATAGFNIAHGGPTVALSGAMTLIGIGGNVWVSNSTFGTPPNSNVLLGGGTVSLAAVLTAVRLTTVNGTDTFDAGSVNILYEG